MTRNYDGDVSAADAIAAPCLPVAEDLKRRSGDRNRLNEASIASCRISRSRASRLGAYNVVPLLDGTRTDLSRALPDGAQALRFELHALGDANMPAITTELVALQAHTDLSLPMHPDQWHQMMYDLNKRTNPGCSPIGRVRGVAKLRGLEIWLAYDRVR